MSALILPSLLSANFMRLGEEIAALIKAGADLLHLDIMDKHYVPNLTFGPLLCDQIHQAFPQLKLDVHLMVDSVDSLISDFAAAGATRISIHPETTLHLERSLSLIRDLNCEAGLVLNPATSPDCLAWVKQQLDFVLVMTVNPGFAGQKLIPAMLDKIRLIKRAYPDLAIAVDGGIHQQNIKALSQAGASQFIAGSAIFAHQDYDQAIGLLRQALV